MVQHDHKKTFFLSLFLFFCFGFFSPGLRASVQSFQKHETSTFAAEKVGIEAGVESYKKKEYARALGHFKGVAWKKKAFTNKLLQRYIKTCYEKLGHEPSYKNYERFAFSLTVVPPFVFYLLLILFSLLMIVGLIGVFSSRVVHYSVSFLFILTLFTSSARVYVDSQQQGVVITATAFRTGPSERYTQMEAVPEGTEFFIKNYAKDSSWVLIATPHRTGWIPVSTIIAW